MNERVAVRGLARLGFWIFVFWGSLVFIKGLYDCFGGEPDANYYSLKPWQFVTREQWLRFSGFELSYGVSCLGIALVLYKISNHLPIWTERK